VCSHGDFTEKSRYGASVGFVASSLPSLESAERSPRRVSVPAAPTRGSRWESSARGADACARGSSGSSSTPQPSVASFGASLLPSLESVPSLALEPASAEGALFCASGDRPRATGGSSSDEQSSSHPSSDSSAPDSPMARPTRPTGARDGNERAWKRLRAFPENSAPDSRRLRTSDVPFRQARGRRRYRGRTDGSRRSRCGRDARESVAVPVVASAADVARPRRRRAGAFARGG
jgi:hypothetical protein